jgi:hypothetical protein
MDAMAYDWLHFFQESTKDRIWQGEYRLLLMDGHSSHKTHEFLQFCNEHCIIAYCFPSHITHLLQLLDGQPFQVYKQYYRGYNNETIQWGGTIKEKRDFLCGIDSVRQRTFTARIIRSAFAKRGIYPVDSSMVIKGLKKTIQEEPPLEEYRGNTLPLSSSITNSPPTIVRKLRRSINKAQEGLDKLSDELSTLSLQLNKRLDHIFKGSLIQAELNAQRGNDIQRILSNREHLKTKKTQQQIRVQGALFVKDANRHIKAREAEDIKKQWNRWRRENARGNNAPTPNVQTNDHPGNSSVQTSLVDVRDDPVPYFWIDSTGMR